jgi:ribosomal protein S18 acetylase RimI-like enzyme
MIDVRTLEEGDRGWLERVLREQTAGPMMVSRGRLHDGLALPGFVALHEDERAGALLHRIDDDELEVVFIATTVRGVGAGASLLDAAVELASRERCRRAWLVTTNDNTNAIRFYQRAGWDLVALHHHAVETSRALKPAIPDTGNDGIPIRHELEFEHHL